MVNWISILASEGPADNPLEHLQDVPWEWTPTLFGGNILSSQIAVMCLAALTLVILMLLAASVRAIRPKGKGYNLVEIFVLFVRDFIARPALRDKTYRFLPFLLTLFFFLLFCNLFGMIPLIDISHLLPFMHHSPIGGTPTSNIFVTASLAGMVFLIIVGAGISGQVAHFVHKGHSPIIGWPIGFFLYLWSLVPSMPIRMKVMMAPLLIVLEFLGVIAKCIAMCIRLFANMNGGHILLAVLLLFVKMAQSAGWAFWLVAPSSILGSVAISLLELLVAFIQAFIFTFLSALFIGMAVNPHH
jgi:F-type H+-transporting ATPase subunit a